VTPFDGWRAGRSSRIDSRICHTVYRGQRPIDASCELDGIKLILQQPQRARFFRQGRSP